MKMSFLAVLIFIFFIKFSVNGETKNVFSVTEIEMTEGIAQVVLNDSIEIKSIELVITSTGTKLNLPMGVEIQDKYLEESLISAIESGQPSVEKTKSVSYKVTELLRGGEIVIGKVVFNNSVFIECKILEAKKGPWVLWPKNFRIINNAFRKMIEKSLIAKYKEERNGKNE